MKFKNDTFKKSQGGYCRLLDISCTCGHHLFYYQKDGPGPLKRMYLDRIIESEKYSRLETTPIKKVPQLICSECGELLAIPYIYKKENRPALKVFVGVISKKIVKSR